MIRHTFGVEVIPKPDTRASLWDLQETEIPLNVSGPWHGARPTKAPPSWDPPKVQMLGLGLRFRV